VKERAKILGKISDVLSDASNVLAIAGTVAAIIPGTEEAAPFLFALSSATSEAALDIGVVAKLAGATNVSDSDLAWDLFNVSSDGVTDLLHDSLEAWADSLKAERVAAKAAGDFEKAKRILEGRLHYARLLRDIDWWVGKEVGLTQQAYNYFEQVKRHPRELTNVPWIGPVGPGPVLGHDDVWVPLPGIKSVISPLPDGLPPTMASVSAAVTAAGQGSNG
jgi:hypothetical protein